jgi:hypothetical protein
MISTTGEQHQGVASLSSAAESTQHNETVGAEQPHQAGHTTKLCSSGAWKDARDGNRMRR